MRGTRTTLQYNRNHKQIIHNENLKRAINTIKEKIKNEYPLIAEEIRLEHKIKEDENEIKFDIIIKIKLLETEYKIGELEILK